MITVNGIHIDDDSIARELQYHPAEDMAEAAQRASTALVIRQALLDAALKRDIAASPEDGESAEEARIRALLEREAPRSLASDQECRRYYERNPTKFCSSPLVEARHILLAATPGDDSERETRRREAEMLITTLRADPALFADLAQRRSACPSKAQGGNLGQVTRGSTVPEFERQLFRLPEGLCGHPIESRYGFHVVVVDRYIPGQALPYAQARERIADFLGDQAHRTAIRHTIQKILSESEVAGIELDIPDTPLTQ